ncbi:MAG: histidine kinase [Desulfobacteraceae bacterium]|nr:histidine kinase [Desulfobacteraceae bacterium]
MLDTRIILVISFGYMGLLFAIAYYGDKRADAGRSIISNPYIYALSLAVYCTAWTFYGSVGRAVAAGPGFLTIYIGPTLMAVLGWSVIRKIVRISKLHRITSIADFIASRYGKSTTLGGVVTIIAVLGIVPYISLQLKAISTSFFLIKSYPLLNVPKDLHAMTFITDNAFYVAILLAVFAILFGTRHLETTERHEGLVAAIAFESVVKLMAFLVLGVFVTYGIYNGFQDLMHQAGNNAKLRELFTLNSDTSNFTDWTVYVFLSMMAVIFLPRQFQLTVVENVNEDHLNKAIWLFPLYLLAINIFVLPVAFAGILHFQKAGVDADTFVLTLPMAMQQKSLAIFVFIGGLSAATGMVIVETIALSTMICNDLVMPVLLRMHFLGLTRKKDLTAYLLTIRRGSILLVLLLGYAYFRLVGEFYTLVSIGLVSFAAVAQFAPAVLGGIFWKRGTRSGALWGLVAGFSFWLYTLVLPSLSQVGILSPVFITDGPFGIALLKPFNLFGLTGFDHIAHAVFWSILANVGVFICVSLFTFQTTIEHTQAAMFVDVFKYSGDTEKSSIWRGTAAVDDLISLLNRFLGKERTIEVMAGYGEKRNFDWKQSPTADPDLVSHVEKLLAGAIGSASARVMVASVVTEEPLGIHEVMDILDETRQVILYSRELEKATSDLKAANERLEELDKLKDEFISTVSHEFRTPLTSIRSLAEILHDNPGLAPDRLEKFTEIIINETRRLNRMIREILDFQKVESGKMQWHIDIVDLRQVVEDAIASTQQLVEERQITLDIQLAPKVPRISGDRDRLIQVMVNLISNAVKYSRPKTGKIRIRLVEHKDTLRVDVIDNGIGISKTDQKIIFDKFRQVKDDAKGRPAGTGLGLAITKRIVELHAGRIRVKSRPGRGSVFSFTIPVKSPRRNGFLSRKFTGQPGS